MKILISRSQILYSSVILLVCLSFSLNSLAQSDNEELYDNTTVPAKKFLIDGESYTFSTDPSGIGLKLFGVWACSDAKAKVSTFHFTDPETVIATVGDVQTKGAWNLAGMELSIFLKSEEGELPSSIIGRIETTNDAISLSIPSIGVFEKTIQK